MPPIYVVTAYVVVGQYVLLTLNEPAEVYGDRFNPEESQKVTYAFDTNSEEWHKVGNGNGNRVALPFEGPATPLGHTGRVFLGCSCRTNGPVNAYRISVSNSQLQAAVLG